MHKNTKLTPVNRKSIYQLWLEGTSVTDLSKKFLVTRRIIYKVLKRGRLQDFSIHNSSNHRFKQISYGLKRLSCEEKKILAKIAKISQRYEKEYPGEMVHVDTRSLRRLPHENSKQYKSETLYVAIDDYSRYLIADILPRKTKECSRVFLEVLVEQSPYSIECIYSDNGCEFKGNDHHDFVSGCEQKNIRQKFTRPRRPQTNGKAERVIRTILEEWFRKHRFKSREERRQSLYAFVEYYNHQRSHSALKKGKLPLTPCEILQMFLNQKVYTTP